MGRGREEAADRHMDAVRIEEVILGIWAGPGCVPGVR